MFNSHTCWDYFFPSWLPLFLFILNDVSKILSFISIIYCYFFPFFVSIIVLHNFIATPISPSFLSFSSFQPAHFKNNLNFGKKLTHFKNNLNFGKKLTHFKNYYYLLKKLPIFSFFPPLSSSSVTVTPIYGNAMTSLGWWPREDLNLYFSPHILLNSRASATLDQLSA